MIDWDRVVLRPLMKIFGEEQPVVFYPAKLGAVPFEIDGIYDSEYKEVDAASISGFTDTMPVIGVLESTFRDLGKPLPLQDDEVVVKRAGLRFTVQEVQPDSHGWMLLKLNVARNKRLSLK